MKKAVVLFNILLIGALLYRIWGVYQAEPNAPAAATPGIEMAQTAPLREWTLPARAPELNAAFDIRPETAKTGQDKAAAKKGKTRGKSKADAKKAADLPQLFGVFAQNGEWAAILKQESTQGDRKKTGKPRGGSAPGYRMVPQGEMAPPFRVERITPDGVTFGLENGETRAISLFDFDPKWLQDPLAADEPGIGRR